MGFLIAGLLVLIAMIFVLDRPPFYDEYYYLLNVSILQKYKLSHAYLMHHKGAAGPLYPFLHYCLEPVTKLKTPYIRLVNVGFLIASICTISRTLRILGLTSGFALYFMAIPMTYVIAGLALTEMPAIFFLSVGISTIIEATLHKEFGFKAFTFLALGGLCISLAIIGRQPFLVVVGTLPVLFVDRSINYKTIAALLITLLASLILPLYIFSVWHGLVGVEEAHFFNNLAKEGVSFKPEFFLFCTAYFTLVFFIISPGFFRISKRNLIFAGVICTISLIINLLFHLIEFLPLHSIFTKILSAHLYQLFSIFFGALIISLSVFFVIQLSVRFRNILLQKHYFFYSITTVLIAITCIKITGQFSSRYAAQAIPLLIPLASFFYKSNNFNKYRIAVGILIGLLSLLSYMLS